MGYHANMYKRCTEEISPIHWMRYTKHLIFPLTNETFIDRPFSRGYGLLNINFVLRKINVYHMLLDEVHTKKPINVV